MEENQTNQNLNQQPLQLQSEQLQQSVQQQTQSQVQSTEQASAAMQIQQLLIQQQQYQQQYNQLVDYVKKTPNLPIEQVNQIKLQLDQLNALFVQGKQQLQALGYTQVQVQKPTEVKKGSKNNFSFKKLAIGCGIVVVLILAGFFVTLSSLIKNPWALQGIGVSAADAKMLMMAFCGLIFGSIILLMLGVVISNIYRLITVKNQSKGKFVLGLLGGLIGAGAVGAVMGIIFGKIGGIVVEIEEKEYDLVQPYLVGRVENVGNDEFLHPYDNKEIQGIGTEYDLIAPAEMAFSLRVNEFTKYLSQNVPGESENFDITLSCGNGTDKNLSLMKDERGNYVLDGNGGYKFQGTCLYDSVGEYKYSINVAYDNKISKERKTQTQDVKSLKFTSAISIASPKLKVINGEFNLEKAPAKITVDSTQIFRDFGLGSYEIEWDLDGDFVSDRVNQVSFDYSYKVPKVYYVTYKIPGLSNDMWYRFPVRVEQSDRPICGINVTNFPGTTKYQISTDFVDASSAATISSYRYTIQNVTTKQKLEILDNYPQEFSYTFPEEGSYVVILDYVTVDGKDGQCESDTIQLKKETFRVEYVLEDSNSSEEICNSNGTKFDKCTQINLSEMPKTYQLKIKSITPYSTTIKKVVSLDNKPILNDNDTYTFNIPSEGTYDLSIVVSDEAKGIEEITFNIKFIAKKADIVGKVSVLSSDTREEISEGFEPLSVILDASKTEINVEGDEIVYFTWDFGDGEQKKNQQNGVVSHTYNYNYVKENGTFQPKVIIETKKGNKQEILGPVIYVKKGLISVDLYSPTHPSRQVQINKDVTFEADFDGLPEKMVRDFGDGSPKTTCQGRVCTEVVHSFQDAGLYSVTLSLEFESGQQVDESIDFKVY